MDEETTTIEHECGPVNVTVTAPWETSTIIAVVITLALVALSGWGTAIYTLTEGPSTEAKYRIDEERQVEIAKAQCDAQLKADQRVRELQMLIAKSCVEKGGTPQFVGANVTCAK